VLANSCPGPHDCSEREEYKPESHEAHTLGLHAERQSLRRDTPPSTTLASVVKRAGLAVLAAVLAASCSSDGARHCTLVGLGLSSAVAARSTLQAPDIVRLCIADKCSDAVGAIATVAIPDTPKTYHYNLVVSDGGTERTIEGEVAAKRFHVNGKGCPPAAATASIIVGLDGAVAITYP